MNRATRTAAAALGVYAGLLGAAHGFYEVIQGGVRTEGIMFNAIGPPCLASKTAHACLPAMSLIPNLQTTGILAVLLGLIMVIWAAAFIQRKLGGPVMILLSILLLLVGGGFIPPMIGILSGVVGSRINAPLSGRRLSERVSHNLARLWPWSMVAFFAWILIQMISGSLFADFVLKTGSLNLFIEFGLVVLAVLSAFANDMRDKP